jgi:hypothetical protein
MNTTVSIVAALLVAAVLGAALLLLRLQARTPARSPEPKGLPDEWPLVQRPIFSPEERALYRQLRTALPHHTVLAKLPLVRFCQPQDRAELRYWFNLLGPIHVSFVVCADNGRVLAAVDVERPDRAASSRAAKIKQSVLEACRVRYVKCRSDQLPSVAELQMLVPHPGEHSRPLVPGSLHDRQERRSTLAHTVRARHPEAQTQWYESGFSQDSFFSPESMRDPLMEDSLPPVGNSPVGAGVTRPSGPRGSAWAGPRAPIRRSDDFGPSGDSAGHIIGRV